MSTCVIYLGGDGPYRAPTVEDTNTVIAADSGLDLAYAHGVAVDVLVGDLDSVSPGALERASSENVEIRKSSTYKDETDFEIALNTAHEFDTQRLVVVGGDGQRVDHLLGNISVLAGQQTRNWVVDAYLQDCVVSICRNDQPRKFTMNIGDDISLMPIGASATGVTTTGLEWELKDSTLDASYARGISNVATCTEVTVTVASGNLAVII